MILKRRGFTLVEVMVVTAIIGIVASVAVPNYISGRATASENACHANARQLQAAITAADLFSPGGISAGSLSAAQIEANVCPNFIRSMPHCSLGTYFTDVGGNVICTSHNMPGGASNGVGANNGGIGGTAPNPGGGTTPLLGGETF